MVMGALAIDLRGEWTTHSAREDKRPFACKSSRDGGKGEVGQGGGQDLLWLGVLASTALLLLLALLILVLAFMVFTRGELDLSRISK